MGQNGDSETRNGPGLTVGDLVWRIFGKSPVRPHVYLLFLVSVVLMWASGRAATSWMECAFGIMGGLSLLASVGTFIHGLKRGRWQAAQPPPPLKRRFKMATLEPDEWRVALRLPGAGAFRASGFVRLRDDQGYVPYRNLESFLLGICGRDQHAERVDRQGHPHVTLRVLNPKTGEVYEQIGVTFWWSIENAASPQHAEIEIGYEMPTERREALLAHVARRTGSLEGVEPEGSH